MTPEAFADRCTIRLLENLDPIGRAHLMASLSKEARERLGITAAANRRRQRDDLIINVARRLTPGGTALRAALNLEEAATSYVTTRWSRDQQNDRKPLMEPERSIHRILALNDGKFPAARSIRRLLEVDP
jgi:hypothetical protein